MIHSFGAPTNCQHPVDGAGPTGLIFDSQGNLYGVTYALGPNGFGTVFELSPPLLQGGAWTETILWSFNGQDGVEAKCQLVFDGAGNLYGTTPYGGTGPASAGAVFQLVPPTTGTQWSLNTLYGFGNNPMDGSQPYTGVVFDNAGNLYGTTLYGGKGIGLHNPGWGIVYKLTPNAQLPWSETILYWLTPKSGTNPEFGLTIDTAGNLYGAAPGGGRRDNGAVFRLTPRAGGVYQFDEFPFAGSPNGSEPQVVILLGKKIYGTTSYGGVNQNAGTVFEINGKTESVLYSFCSLPNCADGTDPYSLTQHGGHLFGYADVGGWGGIFELSPP